MKVDLVYHDNLLGLVALPAGVVLASGEWNPSAPMRTLAGVAGCRSNGQAPLSIRFTSSRGRGTSTTCTSTRTSATSWQVVPTRPAGGWVNPAAQRAFQRVGHGDRDVVGARAAHDLHPKGSPRSSSPAGTSVTGVPARLNTAV